MAYNGKEPRRSNVEALRYDPTSCSAAQLLQLQIHFTSPIITVRVPASFENGGPRSSPSSTTPGGLVEDNTYSHLYMSASCFFSSSLLDTCVQNLDTSAAILSSGEMCSFVVQGRSFHLFDVA